MLGLLAGDLQICRLSAVSVFLTTRLTCCWRWRLPCRWSNKLEIFESVPLIVQLLFQVWRVVLGIEFTMGEL